MLSARFQGHLALTFVLASISAGVASASAPVFGSVTAIGGSASDIALDETRGVLYIADFGAHVIDVMSTVDNSIHTSINVAPFPGAIAMSADAQFLVVAHYCGGSTAQILPACTNQITSINLGTYTQQVYTLASAPLGVAFLGSGQALIVTTSAFYSFDPVYGLIKQVATIANAAQSLPVQFATFPGQIIQAALATSGDGTTIWGIANAGSASQLIFQYSGPNAMSFEVYVTSPAMLPRLSVSVDGSFAMVSHSLIGPNGVLKGRYPVIQSSTTVTGVALDSADNVIYAQLPDANQPTSIGGASALPSAMVIMDADNLTFRDRVSIPEDMIGRAVLNAANTMMYVVSESGVMILPVGQLNSYPRLASAQEDVLVTTNFCNTGILTQSFAITDPGGGNTDFKVTTTQSGVTILPSSGVTPATVQVLVDPTVLPGSGGTTAITLSISSKSAVNWPKPVRLLVNNPDPSQRGTVIDQPGVLTDILPDPTRNVIYVLRQDMNQLIVLDGGTLNPITTLRTATSPTMMAETSDGKFLLVGHDDSELVTVYDLTALQAVNPIVMPGGHYVRSIAISNNSILALARSELGGTPAVLDSINLLGGTASPLTSLGQYINGVSAQGILTASPSGANILYASPDGTVALYTSAAGHFVNSRHDLTSLSGALAASDFGLFVAGNSILNSSLVPAGQVNSSGFPSSGATFVGETAYVASAASAAAPGDMLQVYSPGNSVSPQIVSVSPVTMSEAPVLPSTSGVKVSNGFGAYGSGTYSSHSPMSFTRTVAPLPSTGGVALLTTSGLTVLASTYASNLVTPAISAITSAADGTKPVAPGSLVSIYGQNLSAVNFTATTLPLSTGMGNACMALNGAPIPLLYVSSTQINAQLPYNAIGNQTLTIHSPGGVSSNYLFTIQPTAPSVFVGNVGGTQVATIVRADNGQLVTPTNPIHPKDTVIVYLNGMGQTNPAVKAGQPAPASPLAWAAISPNVTLGGTALSVSYAGLVPGEVGLYQINATVPSTVPTGLSIPFAISQGGAVTTVDLRVVN